MSLVELGQEYFRLEELEMLAAAIEARKPDPAAVERLRAIQQFFDMSPEGADSVLH